MIDNNIFLYINELINVYNYFKSIPKASVKTVDPMSHRGPWRSTS